MSDYGTEDVTVYSNGIIACSVCVPKGMPRDEVEDCVNIVNPTGTNGRWAISEDETFSAGDPNPCQCNDDTERLHYLMNC